MADTDRSSVASGSIQTTDSRTNDSDITSLSHSSSPAVIQFKPISQPPNQTITSDQLPSRKLQFSVWHDLRKTEVEGSQLKAPRVRRAPAEKEEALYLMVDEDNNKLHHDLHGAKRRQHRDHLENWERAQLASFTCQDLHHGYQSSNTGRILSRLKHVTYLNLRDNTLVDLSSYNFYNCEYVNLDKNFIASFKNLPGLRKVRYLTLIDNEIATYAGLSKLRSLPLEELHLRGNPVFFRIGYRQRVFAALPGLKFLDGVAKQEEDTQEPPPDQTESRCVIS